MKTYALSLLILLALGGIPDASALMAQSRFEGSYTGTFNQDLVRLHLKAAGKGQFTGTMEDSQQRYQVSGKDLNGVFTGTAEEASLGIRFHLSGRLEGSILNLRLQLDMPGNDQAMEMIMQKEGKTETVVKSNTTTSSPSAGAAIAFPSGAEHDPQLTGSWTKEELYQSGYGGQYMGASHKESWILHADGRVSDGGSQSTMSGDHYFGQAGSEGFTSTLPGVYWYNLGNQLYLLQHENGKTESIHLGRYYIENGNLLITATNGTKTLLRKN
jgi:hypothetical protein